MVVASGSARAAGNASIDSAANAGKPAFASGYILVAPYAGTPDAAFEQALAEHGGHSLGKLYGLNVHAVEVVAGLEEDTVARLTRNPHVRFAEVDQLVTPAGTANDPYFASEWHLPKIGAPTAWNTSTGKGVIIAILDSGVDGTHPDLAAQMVPGWNFYDNNSNTADVTGHGTAVAGAAAATTNNALGVASVAGGAKIMPIRISDTSGNALWSSIAQAITWAADHGARVVNFSYSGISANSSTVHTAATYLRSKGGTLYIAAGNTGTNDSTAPSSVITVVSATDQNDNLASFSTYGSFVDIAAPGVNIISTQKGGGYCSCGGTSLATPIVAATAALILARRPDFGAAQVDSTLKASATDLAPAGTDIYFGAGRVNAAAAVALAAGTSVDSTPPTVAIASPTSGSTVAGIVPVTVNATDNIGVTKVDLRVNGTTVANDTLAPFQFSWDSTTVANGSVTLTAVAHDAAGNSTVSAGVALNVSNTMAVTGTTVWVDDAVPTGATLSSSGDSWSWVSSNPAPYKGALAHQSALLSGYHSHVFLNATATLAVAVGDTLFAYVYLDPANPPSEVMLQWNDGSWEHRAYWGTDLIGWGTDGTASRRYMGPLPAKGQWVRLAVPASQVGLEGRTLNGMAYSLYNGRATWDYAGK